MKRGKERKERRREGGEEEEWREEHVFLTFRMVKGRASDASARRSAWTVTFAHHGRISFTTLR